MKPYFAKYLPVEGEIKDGDSYLHFTGRLYHGFSENATFKNKGDKKVKLFLCSRDIPEQGDLAYPIGGGVKTLMYHNVGEQKLGLEFIKVIGEISPEAKWVKEGDEFDEYRDVWYFELNGKWKYVGRNTVDWVKERGSEIKLVCKVKGPCGHFH